MSDELFDKLDIIDNKSLFVRKLVERELNVPGSHLDLESSQNPDIAILKEAVSDLSNRLSSIEHHYAIETNNSTSETELESQLETDFQEKNSVLDRIPETEIDTSTITTAPPVEETAEKPFEMPELKPPVEETVEKPFEMPELKPPVEETAEKPFAMPELKPPVEETAEKPFAMPELKPPVEETAEIPFKMPDLKPPVEETAETPFEMPELKPPVEETAETPFEMPELKPPVEETAEKPFAMPELKPPVEETAEIPFKMPELKPPVEETADKTFEMPELKPPVDVPGFSPAVENPKETPVVIPDFGSNENAPPLPNMENIPPFELPPMAKNAQGNTQASSAPPGFENKSQQVESDGSKPDKLESNILMYMPHGAKVKKSIIESLVSKQFTNDEVNAKVQEMFAKQVLSNSVEDGVEYLIRL